MPLLETPQRFSGGEMARRFAQVRERMRATGVDVLLIYGVAGMGNEVLYLSEFPVTREALLIFPLEGEATLLVQMYNHVPCAMRESSLRDVRWGGADSAESAAAELRRRGLGEARIGLVGPLPMKKYRVLERDLPECALVEWDQEFVGLRLVKSQEELASLRAGAELSDRAIEALEREVRPGLVEHELAAIVESAYLGHGGGTHIHYLATTPMSAPDVCVPSQILTSRVLQTGDVLLTEISAHYRGYAGQILRPFSIGADPTPEYQRLYEVASEAFDRIASVVRPGATSEDILNAGEYIHHQGFTICDDLVHGFGGGYLPPILRTRRTSAGPVPPFTLAENMTIVIQPNVITPDGTMGVQLGELVRVTADGVESLHRYPRGFIRCA